LRIHILVCFVSFKGFYGQSNSNGRFGFQLGPQECPKASLLEVFVCRQRLNDTRFTHYNEGHTIYQTPGLIKTGSIQRETLVKQIRVQMNYLDFAGCEKVVYYLNRGRSKVFCQGITNFKEYSVSRKKRASFKL